MAWFIDAWDPLGGQAFASQRRRNQDLVDCADTGMPIVRIGPPDFRPEQIANAAVAIAACRSAHFDPRLPPATSVGEVSPDEVAFPSADAVADFVRRGFTAGGRGRGGGGDTPQVEGGEPSGPPEDDGEGSLAYAKRDSLSLVDYLDRWRDPPASCAEHAYGIEGVYALDGLNREVFGHGHFFADIESGALQSIAALLDGFPRSDHDAYFERWQSAATTLNSAIAELGLWRSWLSGGAGARRANVYLRERVAARVPMWDVPLPSSTIAARQLLMWPSWGGVDFDMIPEYLELVRGGWPHWLHGDWTAASGPVAERYEALFTWPLLSYARNATPIDRVGPLLATFVASPGEFLGKPRALLDIVGFAAAFLASRSEERDTPDWRQNAAAGWLALSMPRYRFGTLAERTILDATAVPHAQMAGMSA
jgi:hypothetical protein